MYGEKDDTGVQIRENRGHVYSYRCDFSESYGS